MSNLVLKISGHNYSYMVFLSALEQMLEQYFNMRICHFLMDHLMFTIPNSFTICKDKQNVNKPFQSLDRTNASLNVMLQ
jgi:hypothetical protein